MSGPAIFAPDGPSEARNPIFNPDQNQATGMANVPGQFAGAASALSQLFQFKQSQQDQAIGQLARLHAAVDNGMFPQEIFNSPEAQALFQKAGLDAMAHQKLLPKVSDIKTQRTASEINDNPLFAPGTAGGLDVAGLTPESKLNVEGTVANDTRNTDVARELAKSPAPATATNLQSAEQSKSVAADVAGKTDIKQAWFSQKAVGDATQRYNTDPQFRNFIEASRTGVLEPYVEILKQFFASQALNKQAQANGAQVFTAAFTQAGSHYEIEHKDWLDKLTQASDAYRNNLVLSAPDEDKKAQDADVANFETNWRHQNPEPSYEGVMQRDVAAAGAATGMTPQQMGKLAQAMAGVTTTTQLESKNPRLIGSIIEQAKVNPNKIILTTVDGQQVPGTLEQLLTADPPLFTDNEINYIRHNIHTGPNYNPNKVRGATGGGREPAVVGGVKAPPSKTP